MIGRGGYRGHIIKPNRCDLAKMYGTEKLSPIQEQNNNDTTDLVKSTVNANGTDSKIGNGKHNDALEEFGLKFDQKPLFRHPLAVSPPRGTLGRSIKLITNCFRIEIPDGFIYHYTVEIHPKMQYQDLATLVPSDRKKKYRCIGTMKNREIMNALMNDKEFKKCYPAYDGRKNLFTRTSLQESPMVRMVFLPTNQATCKKEEFVVNIKPVKKKYSNSCTINLDCIHEFFAGRTNAVPHEAFMAVETVLRNRPCMQFQPVGRSFYCPPANDARFPIGAGKEIWFGYHQSLRMGQWGPLVNLDISATAFYDKGPVIDYICKAFSWKKDDFLRRLSFNDFETKRMTRELRNLKIQTSHLNYKKKYTVLKISKEAASKIEFTMTKNDKSCVTNVSDYFQFHHKIKLNHPHLPCVQVSPESKKIWLPLELCDLVDGQHYKKMLSDDQKKEMIKFTSHQPHIRFLKIAEIARQANFNEDATCKEFQLRVDTTPIRLEGRVLKAPPICYHNNVSVNPTDGHWDVRGKFFARGAAVERWVLLSFADSTYCSQQELSRFSSSLCNVCCERGMAMEKPTLVELFSERRTNVETVLENMKNQYNAKLAVIVIPKFNKTLYGTIKNICEVGIGLKTQCVRDDNVKKCSPSVLSNLSLKVNAKMGGVNSFLSPCEVNAIMKKPIIVIGADVSYPAQSEHLKFSVAAVVGSLDAYTFRYAATFRAQYHSEENKKDLEIIQELKVMVMEVLRKFYRHTNGKKPEKIIFYRDGVSDSQFEKIQFYEVNAVRQACLALESGYNPGISFIVVQKRHHVRFQVQNLEEGVGKWRNVPPGTTVDTGVTHPTNFSFFQCSHNSSLGTTRPAFYTVLIDDNGLSADTLQSLTYHLSYVYARCTKSISLPAPIMYAHLAAARARLWLATLANENSSDSDSLPLQEVPEEVKSVRINKDLGAYMYFV